MSKKYRKVNERMKEAAVILDTFGWKAHKLAELFNLSRSSAYRLWKAAREENNRRIAELEEKARTEQEAQEAMTASSLRDSWQRSREDAGELRRGYSFGQGVRRFRS